MKNSLILEEVMWLCRGKELQSFPIFPFPSLLYLPTFQVSLRSPSISSLSTPPSSYLPLLLPFPVPSIVPYISLSLSTFRFTLNLLCPSQPTTSLQFLFPTFIFPYLSLFPPISFPTYLLPYLSTSLPSPSLPFHFPFFPLLSFLFPPFSFFFSFSFSFSLFLPLLWGLWFLIPLDFLYRPAAFL